MANKQLLHSLLPSPPTHQLIPPHPKHCSSCSAVPSLGSSSRWRPFTFDIPIATQVISQNLSLVTLPILLLCQVEEALPQPISTLH